MSDHDKFSDSAGVAWEGRSFDANPFSGDNGLADQKLLEAIANFQTGVLGLEKVYEVFASARFLIPLVAELGETGVGAHGQQVDKSAELSIVTVLTPDNQKALPVFSSVAAMTKWNPDARPVPNDGRKVCLAAASEGNTRIVLDPLSETELVIRRPAIAAIAQGFDWLPPERNPEVVELINLNVEQIPEVESFTLVCGDPTARLRGQELLLVVYLQPGLSENELKGIEGKLFEQLGASERFVELVDSLAVKFLPVS
jgi:hypothetical protein